MQKITNHNLKDKKNGFTLIELLLYVGILILFIGVVTTFIFTFMETKTKNNTISEVDMQGAFAIRYMSQTIRNASSINHPTFPNSSNNLSLDTHDPSKNPTVFDISDGSLRVKEGEDEPILLTNSNVTISQLSFENLSRPNTPGNIKIMFTINYKNPENLNIYDYQKSFYQSASLRKK